MQKRSTTISRFQAAFIVFTCLTICQFGHAAGTTTAVMAGSAAKSKTAQAKKTKASVAKKAPSKSKVLKPSAKTTKTAAKIQTNSKAIPSVTANQKPAPTVAPVITHDNPLPDVYSASGNSLSTSSQVLQEEARTVNRPANLERAVLFQAPVNYQVHVDLGYTNLTSLMYAINNKTDARASTRKYDQQGYLAAKVGLGQHFFLGLATAYSAGTVDSEENTIHSTGLEFSSKRGAADPRVLGGFINDYRTATLQIRGDVSIPTGVSRSYVDINSYGDIIEDAKLGGSEGNLEILLYNRSSETRFGGLLGVTGSGDLNSEFTDGMGVKTQVVDRIEAQARIGSFIEFPRLSNLGMMATFFPAVKMTSVSTNVVALNNTLTTKSTLRLNDKGELRAYLLWKVTRTLSLTPTLVAGQYFEAEQMQDVIGRGNYYGGDLNLRFNF